MRKERSKVPPPRRLTCTLLALRSQPRVTEKSPWEKICLTVQGKASVHKKRSSVNSTRKNITFIRFGFPFLSIFLSFFFLSCHASRNMPCHDHTTAWAFTPTCVLLVSCPSIRPNAGFTSSPNFLWESLVELFMMTLLLTKRRGYESKKWRQKTWGYYIHTQEVSVVWRMSEWKNETKCSFSLLEEIQPLHTRLLQAHKDPVNNIKLQIYTTSIINSNTNHTSDSAQVAAARPGLIPLLVEMWIGRLVLRSLLRTTCVCTIDA